MVTLKQIAEIAGVSVGTVDRALNNRGRVNPQVAEQIKQIAQDMNYQPNKFGRTLALIRRTAKLGIIVQSTETPFIQLVLEGIQKAETELKDCGVKIITKTLSSVNVEHEIAYIDELLSEKIDGLALLPIENELLREKINYITENLNIPVVTFNSDIPNTQRICFVGQDSFQSGKTAAQLMGMILPQGGKVLILSGHKINHNHQQRVKGFIKEITCSYPKIELLEPQFCSDNNTYAKEITLHTIQTYSNLCGIFVAANGQSGVCKALEEAKLKDKIRLIVYDETPKNKEYLLSGHIDFLIGQNSFIQGYQPLWILYHYIFTKTLPEKEYLYTDIVIKTRYNI